MDFPNKVSLAATFVGFWNPSTLIQKISLTIFFIFPIVFNFWYVRNLGEIEYWITAVKIIAILVLIVTGILIAIGLSTDPLRGTSSQYQPVPCSSSEIGSCVPLPGLISLDPHYLKY